MDGIDLSANTDEKKVAFIFNQLRRYKKNPKGIVRSWTEAQQAGKNTTENIFLETGGFPLWFAYFLLKASAKNATHFPGKAECDRIFTSLDTGPIESRKRLAEKVATKIPPDIAERINTAQEKIIMAQQPYKRQCTAVSDYSSASVCLHTPTQTCNTCVLAPIPNRLAPSTQVMNHPPIEVADAAAEEHQVEVRASLVQTMRLFPPEFANGIKRIPDPQNTNAFVAAMFMTFPPPPVSNKFRCTMSLEITEEKVEYLAWELFRIRTETRDGLRYVYYSGAKALPNPKTTFQGCRREVIPSIFGTEITDAIAASVTYQEEERQGRDRTDCVSMVISHEACSGAIIYMDLGEWQGTQIKKKLYK